MGHTGDVWGPWVVPWACMGHTGDAWGLWVVPWACMGHTGDATLFLFQFIEAWASYNRTEQTHISKCKNLALGSKARSGNIIIVYYS